MIKEKHDKGEGVKEESGSGGGSADKETAGGGGGGGGGGGAGEVRVKKEDDGGGIKKEPDVAAPKNGAIIGSTNTGTANRPPKSDEEAANAPAGTPDTAAALKTEECLDGGDLGADLAGGGGGGGFPLGGAGGGGGGAPPDGVQPLASNVINKQQGAMDVHYMQQQSQIFVFSTSLANSGADEVMRGRYPSIIAYHCDQPGTKKYLEKNPLKVTQFNRQNPAQWLNNFNMMKNKGCNRSPGLGTKPPPHPTLDTFLGPDGLDDIGLSDSDLPWDQKNNHHHLEGLEAGVKVPDENLTPQQRQHRQESLATIRKFQQLFFPEDQSIDGSGGGPGGPGGQPPPGQPNDPNAMPNMPPNMPPNQQQSPMQQVEWQKMQSQFYDDKKKPPGGGGPPPSCAGGAAGPGGGVQVPIGPISGGAPAAGPPGGSGGRGAAAGTGPRLQGPPPPYHQTPRSASVPIALQSSPSPASPNNPTSNLSLPSPRASSSALNSPAADPGRQQFGGGGGGGMGRHMGPGQSPTSQDSPSAPRLNHSNPGTPLSAHMSPSVNSGGGGEPPSTHQSSDGMFGRTLQSMAQQKQQMGTLTNACPTTPSSGAQLKEPNLMPVPSPQQIQYLNTFEGQELIIQKQPNTSLKDGNIISPPVLPTTMDSGFPGSTPDLGHRVSGPNTPTSIDGPRFPPTPGLPPDGCRFSNPSPHTPTPGDKPRHSGPGPTSTPGLSPSTVPGPNSDPLKNDLFPTPSPHMMDVVQRFPPGPNASPGAKMGGGGGPPGGPGFVNVSPQGKPVGGPMDLPNYSCGRGENVPLNPNCANSMAGNPKVSQFDPISSLTQMSQQLTNSVASSLNGQPNQGGPPAMMNFGSPSMHMMEMGHGMADMIDPNTGAPMLGGGMVGGMQMQGGGGGPPPPHVAFHHPNSPMGGPMCSLSPKLPGAFPNHMPMPRMMGRPPGPQNPYNGANVQVKPNAPNTIQYLPAKPQVGQAPQGPRGPPSLDFLTRLAGPMNMMDNKMGGGPPQNMQYFPNNGGPMQGGGPMPPHMGGGHMDGGGGPPMPPDMGMAMGGGPMGNGGPMMGPNMGMVGGGGPGGGMMPMQMRGPPMRPPMMRLQMGGYGGGGGGGGVPPDGMFPQGVVGPPPPGMGGNPNAQMFVTGPKGSPMGMAPDASQPLPPSMGQNNSFKSSPFVGGPTTADPTYAQQFHNFQQQLYATSTRSQMGQGQQMGGGGGPGGPGPPPPHMQQPPYFNPK